jgi:DNA replication and repair protein RecF
MFISALFNENIVSISFDKEKKKKKFLVNSKSILRKKINLYSSKIIIFSPITMNLFYFSPSLRRKFLDEIIEKSFPEHKENLKKYENILKNRNKLLKKIKENNYVQDRENLDFWTKQLINSAIIIYKYRRNLIDFIEKNIYRFEKYFDNKNVKIDFFYDSKINFLDFSEENFEKNLISEFEKHFKKNLEVEIILARTTI